MSDSVIDILQRYIEEHRSEGKTPGKSHTVAAEAKILGISTGTLSQLRNGKPITHKVIEKIAEKLANNNEDRRRRIQQELRATLNSSNAETATVDAIEEFRRFQETSRDANRLICCSYRDVPQSTDTGTYPGYINTSASIIIEGLNYAFFQPFGPVEEIKKKLKDALDNNNKEAEAAWKYIHTIATGVHEVFVKTKISVENGDAREAGKQKGQVVLYEASNVSSLATCDVNSRVFYSSQISAGRQETRVVQLIRGKNEEKFIECTIEPAFTAAVAAQFYPIPQYWRSKGCLPVKEDDLMSYYSNRKECPWKIWNDPVI
jgi:transcriptional regulator with XRE-family HTH domain